MRHGLPRNCLFRIPVAKIVEILYSINCGAVKYRADMMELADMQDLGSCAVRRVGSSPTIRSDIKSSMKPNLSRLSALQRTSFRPRQQDNDRLISFAFFNTLHCLCRCILHSNSSFSGYDHYRNIKGQLSPASDVPGCFCLPRYLRLTNCHYPTILCTHTRRFRSAAPMAHLIRSRLLPRKNSGTMGSPVKCPTT